MIPLVPLTVNTALHILVPLVGTLHYGTTYFTVNTILYVLVSQFTVETELYILVPHIYCKQHSTFWYHIFTVNSTLHFGTTYFTVNIILYVLVS
jgi:hypothetical protein